ncbi:LapA family protein [Govanella unica]|uniref:Lipopolysaccharide assembly protein LapA domain-containing protein n=1 Tax=Govanella unica TaxID=2975056 RepID=A0A9X3Z825_9PROT|nr:LapA family protein [Govania unica]MDA5194584.1 lipopolysaccharide assembly protein LapA domain-containing protein [Govania unica]
MIFWLIALAVIALAVLVGVANRLPVELSLAPVPFSLTVPLYLVIFASVFFGLILGWSVTHASAFLKRRRAAEADRNFDATLRR